jgi:polyhydroxyalkanoate synthesis repressor PhaR
MNFTSLPSRSTALFPASGQIRRRPTGAAAKSPPWPLAGGCGLFHAADSYRPSSRPKLHAIPALAFAGLLLLGHRILRCTRIILMLPSGVVNGVSLRDAGRCVPRVIQGVIISSRASRQKPDTPTANMGIAQRGADKGAASMTEETRLIKKYPNRRLYDTATSSYITLADVKQLVLDHVDFKVVDAKTEEDLTRSILLQIILEEEGAGAPMFSSQMLAQIIRFYGNAMQGMMGSYLEKNIQTFMEIQKKLQEQGLPKFGDNPMLNSDAWAQFVKMQGPAIQGLMSNYLEQSANAFLEMQQQMQKQARNIFGAFPFGAFGSTAGSTTTDKSVGEDEPAKQPQKKTAP